jgi:hypothetical protein
MRIAVLVVRHPASRPSPIVPEMLRELARRGCAVDVLTPDEGVLNLAEQRLEHDLYVLKSGTERAVPGRLPTPQGDPDRQSLSGGCGLP